MRCFLALQPPASVGQALSILQDDLKIGRHVDEEDLHLTLAFMGEARLEDLEELNVALEMLRAGPVPLEITGLDTFGQENPRSLHAAVRPAPALTALRKKLATLVRQAGIELPHSRFVPHVTLARFPHRMPPEDHAKLGRYLESHGGFALDPVAIERVALIQSRLFEDGARYDLLAEYRL